MLGTPDAGFFPPVVVAQSRALTKAQREQLIDAHEREIEAMTTIITGARDLRLPDLLDAFFLVIRARADFDCALVQDHGHRIARLADDVERRGRA